MTPVTQWRTYVTEVTYVQSVSGSALDFFTYKEKKAT